jgi:hypothetical protein
MIIGPHPTRCVVLHLAKCDKLTLRGSPSKCGQLEGTVCKHLADHVDGGLMLGETNENYVGS